VTTGYQSRLQERLPARPESIAPLRRAVVAYAGSNGASERQGEDIALAVSEALSNVVLHAYVGHEVAGDVGVDAWIDERVLEVVVEDGGGGMMPRTDSPGLGLGLALIGRLAEQLRIESPDSTPGVRVHMTFAIG
jgi:anti-sigma regulatory factor (Ser/Thr protein kinase)